MITIHQFPNTAHSLAELLSAFRLYRFGLILCWEYATDGSLRLHIDVSGEDVKYYESLISAFLLTHHYHFVFDTTTIEGKLTTPDGATQQQFVLSPLGEKGVPAESVLSLASSFSTVLLMGLRKSQGKLIVRLSGVGAMRQLTGSISVVCQQGMQPREVLVAFPGFKLSASKYPSWFTFEESFHSAMLTLPSSESGALVTGYGEQRQAVTHPKKSDIVLGRIFNEPMGQQLCLTQENLLSSSCIWGAPGYGKTTLLKSLCFQAWRQNVNFLVVEPKQDYRELQRFIPELKVIPSLRGYNPLLPPRGIDALNWIEVVIDMLSLANPLPEESPLPGYLRHVYIEALKHKNLDMGFFLRLYDQIMSQQKLIGEAINFIISGRNRLENLFRTFCGPNFEAIKGQNFFDVATLLNTPTVIEIGQVPTASATSLFTYFVAAHVKLYLQRKQSKHITNLLVLEEAHTILNPEMADCRVRFNIANLLAEGRGQGLSVCVVDQTPSRVDPAIGNLCGNIISLRVVSNADRNYVAEQLGTDPELLNELRKHTALIRTNSMHRPETIHINVSPDLIP